MTTTAIREKLVEYMRTADDRKVKAIYTMVEDEINTEANSIDATFIDELENRRKSFVDGSAKTYTWEETKQAAVKRLKEK